MRKSSFLALLTILLAALIPINLASAGDPLGFENSITLPPGVHRFTLPDSAVHTYRFSLAEGARLQTIISAKPHTVDPSEYCDIYFLISFHDSFGREIESDSKWLEVNDPTPYNVEFPSYSTYKATSTGYVYMLVHRRNDGADCRNFDVDYALDVATYGPIQNPGFSGAIEIGPGVHMGKLTVDKVDTYKISMPKNGKLEAVTRTIPENPQGSGSCEVKVETQLYDPLRVEKRSYFSWVSSTNLTPEDTTIYPYTTSRRGYHYFTVGAIDSNRGGPSCLRNTYIYELNVIANYPPGKTKPCKKKKKNNSKKKKCKGKKRR